MANINFLNIYPEAIEDVMDMCEEALSGARQITGKYQSENDYDNYRLNTDLDEQAKEVMKENFDFDDISNSIIEAYFDTTTGILNENSFFKNLDISFRHYTNCHDSHLYMELPDGSSTRVTEDTDIIAGVQEVVIDKLHSAIEQYLDEQADGEPTTEYPRDYVEEDVKGMIFDESDIAEFLATDTLTENIIQTVTENAVPLKKSCKEEHDR